MKILTGIDLPYSPSCGSTILCDELYDALAPRHHTRFLALPPPGPVPPSRLGDLQFLPVTKVLDTAGYGPYVAALAAHVRTHVDDLRPDLLHAQHLTYGMALALAGVPDLPLVAVCHGTDILSALTSEFHRASVQHVIDRAQRVIFPSHGMLADARAVVAVPASKVAIVPWGLPRVYFADRDNRAAFTTGPVRVLFAGRFQEGKGLSTLLRAIAQMRGQVELTIAGDGPSRADMARDAAELGIGERTLFLGWLDREELRHELTRHHVLVVPSRGIEAFCLVAAEAQACGLPVVHARVGGLPEIADSPDLCFEPDDVAGIVACIERAVASRSAWEAYAQRSLENAVRYRLELTARGFDLVSRQALELVRRGAVVTSVEVAL